MSDHFFITINRHINPLSVQMRIKSLLKAPFTKVLSTTWAGSGLLCSRFCIKQRFTFTSESKSLCEDRRKQAQLHNPCCHTNPSLLYPFLRFTHCNYHMPQGRGGIGSLVWRRAFPMQEFSPHATIQIHLYFPVN